MAHLAAGSYSTWDLVCCQSFRVKNSPLNKAESPLVGRQIAFPRISGWEHRKRTSFVKRIAAAAGGNEEGEVKEKETKASTLKQLDQQLATLADRDDSAASRPSLGPSTQQLRPSRGGPGEQKWESKVEWPEFSAGFLGFAGFALLLLTLINNLLYRAFLGPPVVPYRPGDPVLSSADEEPRYRITTLSEEREAEAAKAAAQRASESPAIVSREAPALSSE
ncbi:hypothetical protein R1flu_004720 [Riccia fluitans]|uniref:Uncharacterized protein n=1 Tax=Riccia fluitans TaxID=41844 RepID=A0ABD1YR44_9MARC